MFKSPLDYLHHILDECNYCIFIPPNKNNKRMKYLNLE